MPPGKRRQSNAMLYTLIIFVGLFIAATTVAVIYYVKAEELRTRTDELQQEMDNLATREELRTLGGIVGAKLRGQSNLGTVVEHLNQMVRLVKGAPVQTTSAEVKVADSVQAVEPLIAEARQYVDLPAAEPNMVDPNNLVETDAEGVKLPAVAMTTLVQELIAKLVQTIEQRIAGEQQLQTLRSRFDDAIATMQGTEQTLTAKVDEYRQQVDQIKSDYNDLRLLVQQNSEEQVATLLQQLEQSRADGRQLNQNLRNTQAELNVAQGRLQGAMAQVNEVKPAPDAEAPAYIPDGQVIFVDPSAGIIRLDLGSQDRIYRGLTFGIYDRAGGIPRDGEAKAEVEVIQVNRRASAARILSSSNKNPIITGDLAANLIWDSSKENRFVVAGEFDLDKDDNADYDAIRKIGSLIEKWGGAVADTVTAETDYVILGSEPEVPPEPSAETLTVDPTAMERHNAARLRNERYSQIRQQAESLWVPIFNYDRFLHFTGYASQVGKPGAF